MHFTIDRTGSKVLMQQIYQTERKFRKKMQSIFTNNKYNCLHKRKGNKWLGNIKDVKFNLKFTQKASTILKTRTKIGLKLTTTRFVNHSANQPNWPKNTHIRKLQ